MSPSARKGVKGGKVHVGRRSNRATEEGGAREKRRFLRREVVDSFGVSLVIPQLGDHRLEIRDLSEDGIGIELEESSADSVLDSSRFKPGRTVAVSLYLNRSLHLPLEIEIVRNERANPQDGEAAGEDSRAGGALLGARWSDREGDGYAALLCFIQLLDKVGPMARLDGEGA